jgi:uncharacterized protein YceK
MKIAQAATASFVLILMVMTSTGCATYRTISEVQPGSPKVFSGARLDAAAITRDEYELRKFRAAPPPYPLVDLPFSLAADAFLLPLTFPPAFSESVFGH